MSNKDGLSGDNRTLFSDLCGAIGYCCPYAFIRCHKQTGLIAARLGISDRTVRRWKAKFKLKEIKCEGRAQCLLPAIRRAGK